MNHLTRVMGHRWARAAIGMVLCALLIAFAGPYLSIGDWQPLADVGSRVLAIVLVATIWINVVVLHQWLGARRNAHRGDELAEHADGRIRAERDGLRARFDDARVLLRRRRDGSGHLQDLPWYVVIGAPGSGKSTLLEHSGLEFPLPGSTGKRPVAGMGRTRQCDWWFTDRAVFLDTAGRYTTQDSDPEVDAPAWDVFLQTLRRYRGRRRLNGVILTMNVAELLTMDAGERQHHADTLRERLDEMGSRLGPALPVYLVFTKLDLVAGFLEHFDGLDTPERTQVWGATFTPGESIDGSASRLLGEEFDALLERIDTATVERMHAAPDVRRRARILSFPQQLRHVRERVLPLAASVFGSHAYGRSPVLRGMYLTSGTQEGSPVDRVLSGVGRSFGMHAPGNAVSRAPRRTFFIERLFRDVILPEAGFAGADPMALRQRRWLEVAMIGGMALLTAGLLVGMFTCAARNADFVARVQDALHDYPDDTQVSTPRSLREYYAQALQRLDVSGRAEQLAATVKHHRPWSMRFGLFQGDAIFSEVRLAHIREINASVVPGLTLQFRDGLRDAANDPQRLYYALKGYLMLAEPGHRDGNALSLLARERWGEVFPNEASLADALEGHFRLLFDGRDALHSFPVDAALVEEARASLRAADLATLIYGGLKLDSETRQDAPVRLDRMLGLLGNVFHRRSGAPLSKPLAALYTRSVFAAMVEPASTSAPGSRGGIAASVDGFVKDEWVFGIKANDPVRRASLTTQVQALYVADYIRAWDDLLNDLQLQPVANVQEASDLAARLAGPSSPLKALMALVRDNTSDLLRQAPADVESRTAKAVEQRVTDQVKSRSHIARLIAGGSAPVQRADAPIIEHFATINQLTEGTPGATPLDAVIGVLEQMSRTLLTLRPDAENLGQPDPALAIARQEASQLPAPLSMWIGGLAGSSQSLVSKGASGAVADGFREAAGGDCSRFVKGRYPFTANSRNDIPLQNFAELFGNGGRFDTFFRQTLSRSVDTSGDRWRFRDAHGAKAGGTILAQAQVADAIRHAYFRDGPAPAVNFTVSVTSLPPGVSRLTVEVDGQRFEYRNGENTPPMAMHWPGPNPGSTRISAWDEKDNLLPTLDYPGEWGWFHALDAATLLRRTETRFGASFGFGTTRANVDIEASSLRHPFGDTSAQSFRCPV
ncbi:type VI secretion system protein ImpL [Luteibacter sp. Sphag1AF]|uniref:type VI secretion system membrane subunit TssM n=1 Tax=Luteibacter sp. Sphag1AF TaxID=2587031 RepID=UPI001615E7C9|nr:type VI secretion system membrane subunit TssM [Luteibacter sp. Sphag1AF]MBB3228145.1 type VI secretion system protein ImpL [Luteibacter sp. Sphag1AF]